MAYQSDLACRVAFAASGQKLFCFTKLEGQKLFEAIAQHENELPMHPDQSQNFSMRQDKFTGVANRSF